MAAGMRRITKEELIQELQENLKDKEFVGYVFTWGDPMDKKNQHEVILLNKPLESNL